jgi:hypothetical protein
VGEDNLKFDSKSQEKMIHYANREDLGIATKRRNDSTIDLIGSEQQLQLGFHSDLKLQTEQYADSGSDSEDSNPFPTTNFDSQRATFVRKQEVAVGLESENRHIPMAKPLLNEAINGSISSASPEISRKASPQHANSFENDLIELLKMIEGYSPEHFELEPHLKLFIPDYIPCIGDIDPIIKVYYSH